MKEGVLKKTGAKETLKKELFGEGKHVLKIWMEDDAGKLAEGLDREISFAVDTKAPDITLRAPDGFDVWYQEPVPVEVEADDKESGVEQVIGVVNGEQAAKSGKAHSQFTVSQSSVNGSAAYVVVTAKDRAGNQSTVGKSLYIDREDPHVAISGAANYSISSKSVTLDFEAEDDNVILERKAVVQWESPSGKQTQTDPIRTASVTLKKDGIYNICLEASDYSGRSARQEMQVIIDKKDPLIRHVDELNHQYMKEFCWDYLQDEVIWDFTTYTYEIRLDHTWYHLGQKVDQEGSHQLEVSVRDAAGNQAKASARFVIDHTPPDIRIQGVEDGEECEEKAQIQVAVPGKTDRLQKILVNGSEAKLDSLSQCSLRLEERRDYEVCVWAKDLAGNEAKETIMFQVVPKKTWMDKVKEPMENYLLDRGGGNNPDAQESGKGDKAHTNLSGATWIFGILALSGAASGARAFFFRKARNKKKRP